MTQIQHCGTALAQYMRPVKGVHEKGILPGPTISWVGESTDAAPAAALGRAVAKEAFPAVNTPEWDAMNERRAELIRKDLDQGLTPDERDEYERLQRLSLAAAVKAFPGPNPDFEEVTRLRKELSAKSASMEG